MRLMLAHAGSVVEDLARERLQIVGTDPADYHIADASHRVRQIIMAAETVVDAVLAGARDAALEPAQLAHQPVALRQHDAAAVK
jgi:hypothetical protein